MPMMNKWYVTFNNVVVINELIKKRTHISLSYYYELDDKVAEHLGLS